MALGAGDRGDPVGLIFMAIAMVLVRTAGLAARATRLPSAPLAVRATV